MPVLKSKPISINNTSDLWDLLEINLPYDISVINLDGRSVLDINNNPVEYDKYFNDELFKLMIVHELDTNSIPFLKLADYIIYLTEAQQLVSQNIIGIKTPSKTMAYPILDLKQSTSENVISFISDYSNENQQSLLHIAKSWSKEKFKNDIKLISKPIDGQVFETIIQKEERNELIKLRFNAYFNIKDTYTNNTFHKFSKKFGDILAEKGIEVNILQGSQSSITQALSQSELIYIFNKEMSSDEFNKLIMTNEEKLIHTPYKDNSLLAKSISSGCKTIIADGISTVHKYDRPTIKQWQDTIVDILENRQEIVDGQCLIRSRTPIDAPSSMNIIEGKPLTTDYVVVINYRNQSKCIDRAIRSVLSLDNKYSIGIAITDDFSSDDSLNVVKTTLNDSAMPYVIVKNTFRKYSARNLWCAVRYLSLNPNSVIIELDGDDYLADNINILEIIDNEYKKGILKTCGGFQCNPRWIDMESNQNNMFFKTPWNQGLSSTWVPLRTYKKSLFEQVELEYFLERDTKTWLKSADDASIGPRMIELSNGKVSHLKDVLYIYDTSGTDHDSAITGWNPWYAHTKLYHGITF